MENKNFHKLYNSVLKNQLFFESRFLMEDDPEPEKKRPAAEEPKITNTGEIEYKESKLRAGIEGKKGREDLKSKEGLPYKAVTCPSEMTMNVVEFMKTDLRQEEIDINRWKMNVMKENYQINWQNWKHTTPEGVQKIYQDCYNLGIVADNKPFYDSVFAILKNSADKTINTDLADVKYKNAFLNPMDPANKDLIETLPAKGKFPGGPAFMKAFGQLQYLKLVVDLQDKAQKSTAEKQRKATEDPIIGKGVDIVRSNLATFQKAMREGDYATAGVYALGVYAIYQTIGKKIFGGDYGREGEAGNKGIDFKKWFLIGAAAYCGNTFLKNAGYDVLKMAGFKSGDAELQDTPMEVLSSFLQKPEYSEQFKDLDGNVVLAMGDQKLSTLQELRKESNGKGIQFIHPRNFPAIFPDMKNVWPFKMGLGEQGLKDYIGMYNTKISPKEREYIRVGQQLYKLAYAMEITYDESLHQHHKKFQDKTYDQALQDPVLKHSKVRHFLESVTEYAIHREPDGIFGGKKMEDVQARLDELMRENLKGETLSLEGPIQEGSSDYKGTFHGFPVVVVAGKDGYRIYLRNTYGMKYDPTPGPNYIAKVPPSGDGVKPAFEEAIKKIDERMRELIKNSPILGDKAAILSSLKFVGGQWQCEVDDSPIPDLDIPGGKSVVIISPDEDGMSINGKNLDRGERFPREILPRLVNQSDFHALRIFMSAGALNAKYDFDPTGAPNVFTLIIGKKKQIEAKIVYDKATKKFSFFGGAAEEEKLFKSGSGFAEELSDALGEDERMNKQLEEWEKLIQNTGESYVYNFVTSLPNWFTGATWENIVKGIDLKHFTGSVAKNYTISLLEAQKALILTRVAGASLGAKSLSDISKNYDQIFVPGVNSLDSLRAKFSEMNTQNEQAGKNWGEATFNTTIFGEIAKIGINSNDYQGWYAQFVNEIFYKYGMDDLKKGNSLKARDVVKVFSHYTAVVDDKDLDGADLGLTVSKEGFEYIKAIQQVKELFVKGGKTNPTNDEVVYFANNLLFAANLPVLRPADVPKFMDLSAKLEKQAKHKQAAGYAEYVSGKIYEKYNNGDLKKQVNIPIPENQAFWGIEGFEGWKVKHPPDVHEFIDTREILKMERDYVTLDKYLKLAPGSAERAAIERENIILPRKDFKHQFQRDVNGGGVVDTQGFDMAIFVIGPYNSVTKQINSLKLTSAEKAFKEKFNENLEKFRSKYGNRIVSSKLNDLREKFTLSAKSDFDTLTPEYVVLDYTVDQSEYIDANNQPQKEIKDIVKEAEVMERYFDQNDKTITLSVQEIYINQRIKEIFDRDILSEDGKNIYLHPSEGLWDSI